jgi:hypothetical protein
MELCNPHFEVVTNAVRIRDLWNHQISDQAERAALVRWINGEQKPGDPTGLFDSMIAVQAIIYQKALDVVGMGLLTHDGCPMCATAAASNIPEAPDQIINHAADQVLKAAIAHGLVKVVMQ